ncbi:MAG: prephenate dehydrogenase [Lachnospiraceae bacterium]|nr:prephenate dehydrogenase [Lachnospiraceae bacterium]
MKTVGVIGLGLIGGSMAKAVSRAGYSVYGYDTDASVVKEAVSEGVLAGELQDHYGDIELLLVALYPMDVVDIILDTVPKLSKGCIVIDCTGVKKIICSALSGREEMAGVRFIGGHPMAGREVSGYVSSTADLFEGASMILCRDEYTDEKALEEACDFFPKLGFAQVKITTAEEHDSVIAYTSQLAHVVSSSYIKSPTLEKRYGFSAGSFKDMTRVAKLNEEMWADLFLANKDALLFEINRLSEHLEEYADCLVSEDRDKLVELLRNGRIRKEQDLWISD